MTSLQAIPPSKPRRPSATARWSWRATAALMCALASLAAQPTRAAHTDDFNRTDLGSKWVIVDGSMWDDGQHLLGTSWSAARFVPAASDTGAEIVVDVSQAPSGGYGALILGDLASGNCAFVKVQSSYGGTFDLVAFYTGNNGGGHAIDLKDKFPYQTATMRVWMTGTVAHLQLTAPDGQSRRYQYDYGQSFGSGIGVGIWRDAALDDLKAYPKGRRLGTNDADLAVEPLGAPAKDITLAR